MGCAKSKRKSEEEGLQRNVPKSYDPKTENANRLTNKKPVKDVVKQDDALAANTNKQGAIAAEVDKESLSASDNKHGRDGEGDSGDAKNEEEEDAGGLGAAAAAAALGAGLLGMTVNADDDGGDGEDLVDQDGDGQLDADNQVEEDTSHAETNAEAAGAAGGAAGRGGADDDAIQLDHSETMEKNQDVSADKRVVGGDGRDGRTVNGDGSGANAEDGGNRGLDGANKAALGGGGLLAAFGGGALAGQPGQTGQAGQLGEENGPGGNVNEEAGGNEGLNDNAGPAAVAVNPNAQRQTALALFVLGNVASAAGAAARWYLNRELEPTTNALRREEIATDQIPRNLAGTRGTCEHPSNANVRWAQAYRRYAWVRGHEDYVSIRQAADVPRNHVTDVTYRDRVTYPAPDGSFFTGNVDINKPR